MALFTPLQILNLSIFCLLMLTAHSSDKSTSENVMLLAYQNEILDIHADVAFLSLNKQLGGEIADEVKFYLFTRENQGNPDLLVPGDIGSLRNSHFNGSKSTKVLVHGFMDSVNGEMISFVKNNFLRAMDVNILAVDWSRISINIDYFGVAKRTGMVGVVLAHMLDFIASEGYDFSNFHVIGHSLGAHVSGTAGITVTKGKIPRITGLDPALPGFGLIRMARRLEKTDAAFVDCIHTCGGFLGIMEPFCHADFYPNGGLHPQPGCPLLDFGKCSHFRAFKFFAESALKNHVFPTVQCDSETEAASKCSRTSVIMGDPISSKIQGIFYAFTLSHFPFAPNIF